MSIHRCAAGLAVIVTLAGSATAVAAAPANADAGGNASLQYCRSFDQFYPGHIDGPCTSQFQSHDFAGIAALNAYFCKTSFVPAGQFATVGECVAYYS
jgi:hypothetical protein